MASLCSRCALRIARSTKDTQGTSISRSLSVTPSRYRLDAIPSFNESSNARLNEVFTEIREKHLFPAYAPESARKMMYRAKTREYLSLNPVQVEIGGEEVEVKPIDRYQVRARAKLLIEAIELMAETGGAEWDNLHPLLTGLTYGQHVTRKNSQGKLTRLVIKGDRFDVLMKCLTQAEHTGLSLEHKQVLDEAVWGLHAMARESGWREDATRRAMKNAQVLVKQLESQRHGATPEVREDDPRIRPDVLGLLLELSAVYADKYQDGKDVQGSVRSYAERLLSNIDASEKASLL